MREVIKFEADDGSTWDTRQEAESRDFVVTQVAGAMNCLKSMPPGASDRDFGNGGCYIQHKEKDFTRAKSILLDCLSLELPRYSRSNPEWFDPGVDHRQHILSRIVGDMDGPIPKAWGRLMRIDGQFREWGQSYYAANPNPRAKAFKP